MLNYAQILWERLPHTTGSNYVTLLQLSMGSTFWKTCMNNFMKTLHFTFAGLILNSDLLFVVWKRLMKTKMTFRCQTCWIHFRNALWTHEALLRRCLTVISPPQDLALKFQIWRADARSYYFPFAFLMQISFCTLLVQFI